MSIAEAVIWITFLLCTTAVLIYWIEARASVKKKRLAPDPERVLAARFAAGELDELEYARRMAALRVGPPLEAYLD